MCNVRNNGRPHPSLPITHYPLPITNTMEVSLNIKKNEEFLAQFPVGAFLQSRFWSRFLALQGIKNWQLNVFGNQKVIAQCLLYSINLPFGKSYLYSAKGPLIGATDPHEIQESFALILTQIRDITIATRKRQEVFCRLEPNVTPVALEDIKYVPSETIQPQFTSVIALDRTLEELLAGFKEKTRYNIRLAEKKDLKIYWDNGENGIDKFLQLLPKTKYRQKIRSHDKKYYHKLAQAGREHGDLVQVVWAQTGNTLLAANIYVFFGSTVTYLHGAFDHEYRQYMAPYLLQWEAIKRAWEMNFKYYDLWGLAPDDNSKPSWEGFSRFKRGFQGQEISSPGTFDFIYVPVWYNVYTRAREILRNLRRR